jgi:hypothetical protein
MDRGERVLTICRCVFPVIADDGDNDERIKQKKRNTKKQERHTHTHTQREKNECICPSIRNAAVGIEGERVREGSRQSVK